MCPSWLKILIRATNINGFYRWNSFYYLKTHIYTLRIDEDDEVFKF